MKFRKSLSLFVILVCTATFVTPAYAAVIKLPVPPHLCNSDAPKTQQGWYTDSAQWAITGDVVSKITADDFHSAKYLVLELGLAPIGGMQFIWQGNSKDWVWMQTDGVIPNNGTDETVIVIDIPQTAKDYKDFLRSTELFIFLGYYSEGISDLKIHKAYFITDTVTSSGAKNIIKAAKKSGIAVLDFTFDFSNLDFGDSYEIKEVKISRSAMQQFAADRLNMSVKMNKGTVYFDYIATKAAANEANDANITVTLKEVDYLKLKKAEKDNVKPSDFIYDLSIMSGKKPITGDGGTVLLKIPYDFSTPAPSYIWISNNSGKLVKTNCTYDAKTRELVVDLSNK